MFPDRAVAGKMLAQALVAYRGKAVVVYALPRGGVVLGVEIARFLEAPLDLLVVRKIGHPVEPEYAIGAVAEDGYVVANPNELAALDRRWFDRAADAELKEAQRRRRVFLQEREPVDVKGKIAIIVDDGLATGAAVRPRPDEPALVTAVESSLLILAAFALIAGAALQFFSSAPRR